ncbi:hypothetical protein [Candidatus Thioglobus sp.]|uniref:hypothetical protein n=1 Tax=Candidatus Thioglobus sp. TaxID=2026721 RepID=UPI003D14F59B
MLSKSIAIFIAIFIVFKIYFATLTFSNLTLWNLLWYCNLAWLILAFGIYTNNEALLTLVLVTATSEIAWYVELFAIIFNLDYNLTLLDYLLEDRNWMVVINDWMSFVVHTLLFPVAFYYVKSVGFDKQALYKILLFAVSLLAVSFFLSTSVNTGVYLNCVTTQANCGLFDGTSSDLSHLFLVSVSVIAWIVFFFFLLKRLFKSKWLKN